jgi:hypothetical protein
VVKDRVVGGPEVASKQVNKEFIPSHGEDSGVFAVLCNEAPMGCFLVYGQGPSSRIPRGGL